MRIRLIAFYLIVITTLAARAEKAGAEAIRVGISGLSAEFTPIWAAHDRGRFKRYGLDVEVIVMQGGTQLLPAMVAGSIDFSVMGGAYLTGAVKGLDLVMVATHMDKFSLFVDRETVHQESRRFKRH